MNVSIDKESSWIFRQLLTCSCIESSYVLKRAKPVFDLGAFSWINTRISSIYYLLTTFMAVMALIGLRISCETHAFVIS